MLVVNCCFINKLNWTQQWAKKQKWSHQTLALTHFPKILWPSCEHVSLLVRACKSRPTPLFSVNKHRETDQEIMSLDCCKAKWQNCFHWKRVQKQSLKMASEAFCWVFIGLFFIQRNDKPKIISTLIIQVVPLRHGLSRETCIGQTNWQIGQKL